MAERKAAEAREGLVTLVGQVPTTLPCQAFCQSEGLFSQAIDKRQKGNRSALSGRGPSPSLRDHSRSCARVTRLPPTGQTDASTRPTLLECS